MWVSLAEFMGFEQQLQPVWLARDSERIWRGSYKNKAWKHLVRLRHVTVAHVSFICRHVAAAPNHSDVRHALHQVHMQSSLLCCVADILSFAALHACFAT